jgi:prolipoprotein diacylglyceryltransferase
MTVPAAAIVLSFDPTTTLGPLSVRRETLGLAAALLVALLVAGHFASRSGRRTGLSRLRLDDLLYLAMAAVPGAVVGGRLLYVLDFVDYYAAHSAAIVDPTRGGLSLLGAVVGGSVTAAYMARLLAVPARRWLDVASTPLLLAVGLGKVAQLLGGGGQGLPFDGPWAVSFAGPGPWLSPAPGVPAHPSQLYEAAWALAGVGFVFALHAGPVLRALPAAVKQEGRWLEGRAERGLESARGRLRFGYLFAAALAWFAAGRVVVGFTWTDAHVAGDLNAEQVAALAVLLVVVLALAWAGRPHSRRGIVTASSPPTEGSGTQGKVDQWRS